MAAELIFNCLVGLGIVFFLVQAFSLPDSDNPGDMLGAGGFPIILGVLGLIVLAVVTIRVIREKTRINVPMFDLRSLDGRSLALNVILLFVYIMVLDVIGFILATLLYLPLAGWSIGYQKPLRLALYTVGVTVVLTGVFGILFLVPLPRGVGLLRELSYMIF
jgi:hypothetical protein